MKYARIVGRMFNSQQVETLNAKKLLLIQPLSWTDGAKRGDVVVAADACGSGSSEFVYWVASREAAVAFEDLPPVDAAVIGIVEGHQVKDFRKRMKN